MGSVGFGLWGPGLAVYVAGVMWSLSVIDARLAARVGLALLWPLGPLAFAFTIAILLVASAIAFPAFGAVTLLTAAAAWWALCST